MDEFSGVEKLLHSVGEDGFSLFASDALVYNLVLSPIRHTMPVSD